MHGPASPGWLLVALCAATGGYCLLRMRSKVEEQRKAAGGEALMGFGMAAMAVPPAVFTPPAWAWPAYTAVFGAAALRALWALWAARATSAHHLHHLVGTGAMVYMAAAMAASPSFSSAHAHGHDPAHDGSGVPLLTGALLLYFAGYVLLCGVRLLPVAGVGGAALAWGDRPEVARACRLAMGIGMLAMLLTM
ncbi:DUF5134 domain-containing protein [Streptomyces sp. NPDC051677]|uniref:DUF5134 domain-containing protein n=1 Tax=Streptomyces sp. NPDC051677 TaxID=3365669 RepID=UPI0037D2A8DE